MVRMGARTRRVGTLMDITAQAQVFLRNSAFRTRELKGDDALRVFFENSSLIGFLYVFESSKDLISNWEKYQATTINKYSAALRRTGNKASNVYSVFLTHDEANAETERRIANIEEDLTQTRKIARAKVRDRDDLRDALLPLLGISVRPVIEDSDFQERLRSKLRDISDEALGGFLGEASPAEIVQILAEEL